MDGRDSKAYPSIDVYTVLSLSRAMTYPEHSGTCTPERRARTSLRYVIAPDLVSARVRDALKPVCVVL